MNNKLETKALLLNAETRLC